MPRRRRDHPPVCPDRDCGLHASLAVRDGARSGDETEGWCVWCSVRRVTNNMRTVRRPDPREVREENDSVEGRVDGFVVPQFDSSNLRRRVVAG
jgi:hypothetical protein